jgi:hypothetical protein
MTTLKKFIITNQSKPLLQKAKTSIYKDFLQKRERKNTNRWSIVYKTFTYSLSLLSVIGFVFFGLFEKSPTDFSQSVDAQSIGKITNFK